MDDPLWMSAEVQADVSPQFGAASNEVESAMNAALIQLALGSAFNSLLLIHIIRETDSPDYDETKKYKKKRRDFELRLKIPHAAFKAASPLGQRRLVVQNILRAVAEMRKMRVKDVDCDKLEQAIREVAAAHDWLGDPPTLH